MAFTRSFFALLSLAFMTTYMLTCPFGSLFFRCTAGIALGILFFLLILTVDRILKKCSLRSFNTVLLGLFLGYLMGLAITSFFDKILYIYALPKTIQDAIDVAIFLMSAYVGVTITIRSSRELLLNIPFLRTEEPLAKKEGIDLQSLSNAVKQPPQAGDNLKIKIQRYGKEARQGVGYLDDGTMVVVNNGGDFLGELIETQVISVKQTSAGRIIFTNAVTEQFAYDT